MSKKGPFFVFGDTIGKRVMLSSGQREQKMFVEMAAKQSLIFVPGNPNIVRFRTLNSLTNQPATGLFFDNIFAINGRECSGNESE